MPTAVTRIMSSVTQPILVDRIVYATITIVSVLIIYDGWQNLRLVDVIGVLVGPVAADVPRSCHFSFTGEASRPRAGTYLERSLDNRQIGVTILACLPSTWGHRLGPLRSRVIAQRRHSRHLVARGPFHSDIGATSPLVVLESWGGAS
jgi:hypothetical protein